MCFRTKVKVVASGRLAIRKQSGMEEECESRRPMMPDERRNSEPNPKGDARSCFGDALMDG